jgi:hypothetical protein
MKKNIKAKWLDALQSGKYTHSVGELEEIVMKVLVNVVL